MQRLRAFLSSGDPLDGHRWKLVVGMSLAGLSGVALALPFHWGWRSAAWLTVVEVALVFIHICRFRDQLIGKLLIFGLWVGVGELASDAYSVLLKKTLVYPPEGLLLWASPAYMPFSWAAVMVQFGFLAIWVRRKWGILAASAIMFLEGASYIPVFEWVAKSGNYWYYKNCRMIAGIVPWYVILAEGMLCAALPFLIFRIEKKGSSEILLLAFAESAIILAVSWLAFQWVG